ncbi:hypothetical protein PORCRE_4 [Porphyromonas crevioricanis JCM 15906]|uniref:Subtilisin BL n=2 Tax=Porphyromonas crevioricanis TaxID=393921 RepID=A0A2X4PJW8_9PORP|nr:S8 family peptidase [Porphyromonas crevioricanis]GAD04322.1 hypothetical protein PORCRE_4 [Porphyromonas crevioricanis JCM 15906]GAD08494.1 hypothetical protein PORCAN_2142 [Porphyromonas crevioricanis JCM 13913]SJZ81825.1 Subtilase family protein [Porphyromonas crevioricanis]SQH72565.1 Subtilisin BL [Porphyromonas crevioricanis]
MEKKKTYLVTYTSGNVSKEDAMSVLGIPKTKCKDGIEILSQEKAPGGSDVLHFEKMGVSMLDLSETEVAELQRKEEVLAVEEDREVFVSYLSEEEQDLLESLLERAYDESDYSLEGRYADEGYEDAGEEISARRNRIPDGILRPNIPIRPPHKIPRPGPIPGPIPGDPCPTPPWWFRPLPKPWPPMKPERPVRPVPPFPPLISPWKREIMRKIMNDVYQSLLRNIPNRGYEPYTPPEYQDTPWNISLVQAPSAWNRKITGKGVNVAILDTGIASHVDLSISGGVSFVPGVSSYSDDHSHGTHCAGIVAAKNNSSGVVGVAPGANLYAVKVLNKNGAGRDSHIIAGLEWCLKNNIHVASLSLGSLNGPSVAYASTIERCQNQGITVVVAAGNDFDNPEFPWVNCPANSFIKGRPNASPIAVGAVDKRGTIAYFSSRGTRHSDWNPVTCVAPGYRVNSTILGNSYGLKSGTSMACPHVAGLAALLTQHFEKVPASERVAKIKRAIAATSIDLGSSGFDTAHGAGLINCDEATK